MKSYGRRSGSVVLLLSKSDNHEIELSDSNDSDDVSSIKIPESNTCINYEAEQSIEESFESNALIDNIINFSKDSNEAIQSGNSNCLSNDTSALDAFDFLDDPKVIKKRRTNYRRTPSSDAISEVIDDFDSNPMKDTIDDLDSFLSSLQRIDENKIKKTIENNLMSINSNPTDITSGSRKMYGRSRTLLRKESTSDADEEEENEQNEQIQEEDFHPNNSQTSSKLSSFNSDDFSKTHHYNELKHMGNMLRFQDDLEFLTEEPAHELSKELFISKLTNLTLTIHNDSDFLLYINKHSKAEIYGWCFSNKNMDDPIILLLLGYIAVKVPLKDDVLPDYFSNFLIKLSFQIELPPINSITKKIVQMNYRDFLKNTNNKSCIGYTLELWKNYAKCIIIHEGIMDRVCELLKLHSQHQDSNTGTLLEFIEMILSMSKFNIDTLENIWQSLASLLPSIRSNESLTKSLIILTNEITILHITPKPEKESIFNFSLKFVLDNIQPLNKDNVDIIILYLGLCLNIISDKEIDITISEENVQNSHTAYNLLASICKTRDQEKYLFLFNLFYLNFAYIIDIASIKLPEAKKNILSEKLQKFHGNTLEYKNDNLCQKIKYILNTLTK